MQIRLINLGALSWWGRLGGGACGSACGAPTCQGRDLQRSGAAHASLKATPPELEETLEPLLGNLVFKLVHLRHGKRVLAITPGFNLPLLFRHTLADGACMIADVPNRWVSAR